MPMSRPARRTRRKTVFTLVTFRSPRSATLTRSTYRLIQPAQGHKLTLHAFVLRGLAACCARGDARIIRLGAPKKRLNEAQASGNAGAVPAEMLTFDQVHALVADG